MKRDDNPMQQSNGKRPGWHALGPILTIIGVLLLALSPVGYRLGWFGIPMALLRLIPAALAACALGLALSLVAIARTPPGAGYGMPLAAIVVSIAISVIPVLGIVHARQVPGIHDITTDTETPPLFVALAAQRIASPNGLAYGGTEVAAQQKRAYPDVTTLHSKLAPDALFDRAQQAARDCGWELADANRGEGRIEATSSSASDRKEAAAPWTYAPPHEWAGATSGPTRRGSGSFSSAWPCRPRPSQPA
jgi:hypothetical protein